MPPIETSDRHQTAVLWASSGRDAYGDPTVATPTELSVRWQLKRGETIGPEGTVVALDGVVVVDRRVAIGSQMWLGTLEDWYGTGSAGDDSEVYEVMTYNETPDIKDRYVRRTVGLKKYRDTPADQG
jgi:hypothetical protein